MWNLAYFKLEMKTKPRAQWTKWFYDNMYLYAIEYIAKSKDIVHKNLKMDDVSFLAVQDSSIGDLVTD